MDDPTLERRLRWFVVVVVVLGLGIAVLGFLPGQRVYRDSNNCAGIAFGGLFRIEHHDIACTPRYDSLVRERTAGGFKLVAYGMAIFAPAFALWRKPTRRRAWLWVVWTPLAAVLITALIMVFDFDLQLDPFDHVTFLWPQYVVNAGEHVVMAMLVIVLPLILLVTRKPPRVPQHGSDSPTLGGPTIISGRDL